MHTIFQICLSVCLSIYLFICISIYLSRAHKEQAAAVIFSTGGKFCLLSKFTELHAFTLATHSLCTLGLSRSLTVHIDVFRTYILLLITTDVQLFSVSYQ